jgi:hypothetical protein
VSAAATLLDTLRAFGAEVWADGDRVRYRAPAGMLTPSLKDALVRHKAELLSVLRDTTSTKASPAAEVVAHVAALAVLGVEMPELDHFFERRAIIEFDGGVGRSEAELRAATEALELARQRRAGGAT